MNKTLSFLLIVVAGLIFVASQSIFFVGQAQHGLVLQFGEPQLPVRTAGLNFKLPFIQNVVLLEKRILSFDIPKTLGLSSDLKPFEIDNYSCWRIVDPIAFVKTLRTEAVATERLKNIVYSQLRASIGGETLKDVVDTKRTAIMAQVLARSNAQVREYGVEIMDVRIKRTDLPNRQAIFQRMNADREKMANMYRAEGESASRDIRSLAEKTRDIILAEAQKTSTIMRGEADATAMRIFADAIVTSPDFYEFTRSLELYKKSFTTNSRVILSTDDPLLQFFAR